MAGRLAGLQNLPSLLIGLMTPSQIYLYFPESVSFSPGSMLNLLLNICPVGSGKTVTTFGPRCYIFKLIVFTKVVSVHALPLATTIGLSISFANLTKLNY